MMMYLIACPLCMLAGFIDSIAGGGGLISLPAYYLAGLPAHLAAGTNKLSAGIGACVSVARYGKGGKIALRPALLATLGALPGSYLGSQVLKMMDEALVVKIMLFVLPVVCVIVLTRRGDLQRSGPALRFWVPICFLIGLIVGFYDGMIGPGTGTFLILLFTLVVGIEPVTASGSAKVVNLASNIGSFVSLFLSGNVLWGLGLAAAACSMVGNALGASLAIRGGAKVIRWVLVAVLVMILISLAARVL
jgi:uncharacterized membrane protein YfcA